MTYFFQGKEYNPQHIAPHGCDRPSHRARDSDLSDGHCFKCPIVASIDRWRLSNLLLLVQSLRFAPMIDLNARVVLIDPAVAAIDRYGVSLDTVVLQEDRGLFDLLCLGKRRDGELYLRN